MNKLYMQFSNCIPVKGINRSVLYDVHRTRYLLVDNEFAELLISNKNKIDLNNGVNEYSEFINDLVEDEWGIYIDKSIASNFPEINLQWKHYAEITNAQIDFNTSEKDFKIFFQNTLPQFEDLNCKIFQINFLEAIDYRTLYEFLIRFNDTQVHFIRIYLPYIVISQEESKQLFLQQPRLDLLCYYNCPDQIENFNEKSYYSPKSINSREQHEILTDYFTTNIKLFTESQTHNTYYNRKLSIDSNGNIKNTPEQTEIFGNIQRESLKEIISQENFQRLWYVHKQVVDVCKDCEFRHMCVDSNPPKQRENNSWYRSKECNYNPYINKWKGEEGYLSLNECGVIVNSLEFKINEEQLSSINQNLWGMIEQ